MTLGRLLKLVLFLLINSTILTQPAIAEEDVVNGFAIDEPYHPEITPAMLRSYRVQALANLSELLHNPADPTHGSPYATVLLVEFMDFKCPLSERMDPQIQALITTNPSFRVIYKIIPIHGEVSIYAAKAALAAAKQGKYIEYHKALMEAGKTLTQDKIISIAKSLGIDIVQLKTDMNSAAIKQQLNANMALYHKMGLLGTPDLFFMKYDITPKAKNTDITLLLGSFTQDELQQVIDVVID